MEFKLKEEILALSESKSWSGAKIEWIFESAYQSEEPQYCLCGHFPIINICVINNTTNGNYAEVGNVCINKFLGISDAESILGSITKLKKDITRSMSSDTLQYLFEKDGITDFEYKFYESIHRKRNLSSKQSELKEKINNKLLKFTSYEANSTLNKINKVMRWAEDKPRFDTKFIESLRNAFNRYGGLTTRQETALLKILDTWKIE